MTLDKVMRGATDRERELLKRGALVGLRPSAAAASRLSGGGSYSKDGDEEAADWLVRQIIGQVPSVREQMSWSNRMSGIQYTARRVSDAGLAVDAEVRAGDEVRFHVRDATAAKNDLDLQLRRYALERAYSGAASSIEACLVIPCVGRGRLLFGESGSDSRTIGAALGGQAAVGGFFANGELGPVGAVVGSAAAPVYRRRTHQHDYAVVAVVFGEADAEEHAWVASLVLRVPRWLAWGCIHHWGWRSRSRRRRPARGALPEGGPAGVSYRRRLGHVGGLFRQPFRLLSPQRQRPVRSRRQHRKTNRVCSNSHRSGTSGVRHESPHIRTTSPPGPKSADWASRPALSAPYTT